ncbi:hypothetical protein ACHAXA_004266 [Cyclostephanos tholiformis]|uniref:Uncharacterized protein n=1 Tax=Cyclostephanos tholiformis TaxID=382380 RepID=A0ABD3RFN8_9STRA
MCPSSSSSSSGIVPPAYASNVRTTNDELAVDDGRIAIKVSWKGSNTSVKRECSILRDLVGIPHLERCISGPVEYPYEDGRTIIALSPVMMTLSGEPSHEDVFTSDLGRVNPGMALRVSVISVMETMVKML